MAGIPQTSTSASSITNYLLLLCYNFLCIYACIISMPVFINVVSYINFIYISSLYIYTVHRRRRPYDRCGQGKGEGVIYIAICNYITIYINIYS